MRGNGGRKCSGTVAMSLSGGTKGVYRQVSTPMLMSVIEPRKSV
jgi:hypothetical protein